MSTDGDLRRYRLLLRLFPAEFRERHGSEMEALFREMSAQRVEEYGRLGLRFWMSLLWDVGSEALRERWSSTTHTKEDLLSTFLSDVRYAFRQFARQPAYAATIVLLMTLGIAGNAAMFRVYNGLFLKPLPFDEPEQLVDLDETAPAWDLEFLSIAYRDFDTWRSENTTFEAMAVFDRGGGTILIDGEPQRVDYLATTHDIDDVLRIEPLLGRFYRPEEDHPDGPRGALLSEAFWDQSFGSDPDVVGRTVSLNGFVIEVLGILPPEARFYGDADLWFPLRQTRDQFNGWGLNGIGRLRPGVTIEQARADLMSVHKGMIDEFEVNEISSPVVYSLHERYLGDYRLGAVFTFAAVLSVLIIACANIAGLTLVRSLGRGQEVAVRRALGAPRGRIVRQLLTESAVLASLGAALGSVLGVWGSNALVAPLEGQFPSWVVFDLDARFTVFVVLVTVASASLFGLLPALRASRASATRSGGRVAGSISRRRSTGALVAGEVALALSLLVVGSLVMLDVRDLGRADPGFDAEGVSAFSLFLPGNEYEDRAALATFTAAYLPQIQSIPGVTGAAIASMMPVSGNHQGNFFIAEGAPERDEDAAQPVVLTRTVSPEYFEVMSTDLVAGRVFDGFDGREEGTQAIIVNQRFVDTHLTHLPNPVGARVTFGTSLGDAPTWLTVVGVAEDVKHYGVDEDVRPGVYLPLVQNPLRAFAVAFRTTGDPGPILSQARAITREVDAGLPLYNVTLMSEQLDESLFTRRATSWIIGVFSAIALVLSIAGIYGVISYSVRQRTREISLRMAMGARQEDVMRGILAHGMLVVAAGVGVGLLLSMTGANLVSGILVDTRAINPTVYVGVTVLLFAVAGLANYVPARRAALLSPSEALRSE
ncbi:MAG: ABC transporter permease [Gemmatimonadota bacterium]